MSDLYDLPNGWEWKTLNDVFTIERGGSPRPIKEYITDDEDGINWIKIGDTEKGGKYITSTEQKIKPSGLKKSRLVVEGDFIMSNSMSFGRPYIVKTKGAIHDGWLLMRDKLENMDKDFFYYLLSSNYMYQQFTSKASGTTVKNLNIDLVKSTNIPLPPLLEQQIIVSKLDNLFEKIDKSIALHQKNMDEADVFMGSVLNDVFVELEEKYEKEIFDNIKISNVIGLVKSVKEQSPTLQYKYVKMNNITNDNRFSFDNIINVDATDDEVKKFNLQKGDFLFNTRNSAELVGKSCIFDYDMENILYNNNIMRVRFRSDISSYFISYQFGSRFIKNQLEDIKSATTNVAAIYYKTLKEIDLVIPPLQIQQKVVKYLDEISEKIEKVKSIQKEKMDSLKALKASILDKAFRGEL